jgi:hypothetical protein
MDLKSRRSPKNRADFCVRRFAPFADRIGFYARYRGHVIASSARYAAANGGWTAGKLVGHGRERGLRYTYIKYAVVALATFPSIHLGKRREAAHAAFLAFVAP